MAEALQQPSLVPRLVVADDHEAAGWRKGLRGEDGRVSAVQEQELKFPGRLSNQRGTSPRQRETSAVLA